MNQNKVIILVACHKPDKAKKNEVYIPIHVGRSISKYKEEMKDMIGDDTGDNISEKNPFYSELTAQYWAWKNLNSEYVGLCHYRRYFEKEITVENVDIIIDSKYDVLQVRPIVEKQSIANKLITSTCLEDFIILIKCIKKLYHEYLEDTKSVLRGNKNSPFNMFVMRKNEFDKFAEWQFNILFETEKYIRLSSYSRRRRVFGYLSEVLLSIYCKHNSLNVRYMDWVPMIGEQVSRPKLRKLKEWIRTIRFKILSPEVYFENEPVAVGFRIDGIDL